MRARFELTAPALVALVVSALALALMPLDEPSSLITAGVAAVLQLITAAVGARHVLSQNSGVASALLITEQDRRRCASPLRESHPDAAGSVRPRAPGLSHA
jgi:hypothetical protein